MKNCIVAVLMFLGTTVLTAQTGYLYVPTVTYPTLESACTVATAGQVIEVLSSVTQSANCAITANNIEVIIDRGATVTAGASSIRQIQLSSTVAINGFKLSGPGTLDGGAGSGQSANYGVYVSAGTGSGNQNVEIADIIINNEAANAINFISPQNVNIHNVTGTGSGNGIVLQGNNSSGESIRIAHSEFFENSQTVIGWCYDLQPNTGTFYNVVMDDLVCHNTAGLGVQVQGVFSGVAISNITDIQQSATGTTHGNGISIVGVNMTQAAYCNLNNLTYINTTNTYSAPLGIELSLSHCNVSNPVAIGGIMQIDGGVSAGVAFGGTDIHIHGGLVAPLYNAAVTNSAVTLQPGVPGSAGSSFTVDNDTIDDLSIDTTGMTGAVNALTVTAQGYSAGVAVTIQNLVLDHLHIKTDGGLTSPLIALVPHSFSTFANITIDSPQFESSTTLTNPCYGTGGTGTSTGVIIKGGIEGQCAGGLISGGTWPTGWTHFVLIADNTITVGTSAISANTCTSASTVTLTGVTTSTAFSISPSTDISAVTGWGSSGGLSIISWPTANTLNYRVCNMTASNITPSASVTFNMGAK